MGAGASNRLRLRERLIVGAYCFELWGCINWQSSNGEDEMTSVMKRGLQLAVGAAIFAAGIAAGTLHARGAAVVNRFGQPKTVLHVGVY